MRSPFGPASVVSLASIYAPAPRLVSAVPPLPLHKALRMVSFASDALFVAAQSLFFVLPLCSLYAKRAGDPSPCHPPQLLAMLSAMAAFALLIIKFALDGSHLGVWPCVVNLAIRVAEAGRALALHCRADASAGTGLLN